MNVSIVVERTYAVRSRRLRSLLLAPAFAALATGALAGESPADLVLLDGAVYTVDAARSWASAVAVRGGRIVYVGGDEGARALAGPATQVIDLDGKMLLPGFQDSHVHLMTGGLELLACNLNEAQNADEVLATIRACHEKSPGTGWLFGGGWQLPIFPGGNPGKELLDAISTERPIYMDSADGHSAWANTKALALAGVVASTPDPESGRIERDPKTGEPTGVLRENAKGLVSHLLPDPTAADDLAGLAAAVDRAHRFGITGAWEVAASRRQLEALRALGSDGKLNLHVAVALLLEPQDPPEAIAEFDKLRAGSWGADVTVNSVKLFADGVLEAQTGAILEPYLGKGDSRGILEWTPEKLAAAAVALDQAGFQIHVHAIGDRAIRVTFDAIEAAIRANGARDRRPAFAHIQLFAPSDIPRFRELGVTASFQPLWAYEDPYIKDLTVPFLGPERSRWLYPIASVTRTGAVVAGGSDWSVSSMNPLDAIEVAVTRRGPDDPEGPAWIPEERVDLAPMIAAYTINAAWASFREKETGSIEVGKLADLVVLDRNLFAVPPQAISDAKALLTLFGGREVWRDPAFAPPAP